MTCKGFCLNKENPIAPIVLYTKPPGMSPYDQGFKRCHTCEYYAKIDGIRCPCCHYPFRTKTRYNKSKARERRLEKAWQLAY